MIAINEDALICDMAETYGIIDPDALPVLVYARLANGLRPNSRIKMEIKSERVDEKTMIMSLIFDRINGMFAKEQPKSLFKMLTQKEETDERIAFASPEDFERQWENG